MVILGDFKMKNIICALLSLMLLGGCKAVETLGAVNPLQKPLTVTDFCELKKSNLQDATTRYSKKAFTFGGKITAIKATPDYVTVNIDDGDGPVWAKVYNYETSYQVGDAVFIKGIISETNFSDKFKNQCLLLLDNGMISK